LDGVGRMSFLKMPYILNFTVNNTETDSFYSETIPLFVTLNIYVKLDDAKVY
jgi:hypothetical protein